MFKSKRKRRQEILTGYTKEKEEAFDFGRIGLFFENKDHSTAYQILDEHTLADLDFEDVFMCLDRTSSVIGQQYLYAKLRAIDSDPESAQSYEKYIQYLDSKQELKKDVVVALHGLSHQGFYFLQRLFLGKSIEKPSWFWLMPVLSVAVLASLVTAIFYPIMALVAMLLSTINIVIHLWNKKNLLGYSNIIPQLLKLRLVASDLNKKEVFLDRKQEVSKAIQSLNAIRVSVLFFKWESKASTLSEIGQAFEYIQDLIKGAFLIEPIIFFKLLKQIEANRLNIKTIYEAVGQLDMALSIATWRASLPHYTIPIFEETTVRTWDAENMYHPLIEVPIANDLYVKDQKSILLSGSNMSGKTTLIRTIGINALLAQTINTACAEQMTISRFKLYSAIRITDDLLNNSSYYYEEVKSIQRLIKESKKGCFNLFLLDELFKGTNTVERIASGKSVLSYLNSAQNLVCCSTHDLELIDYLKEEYEYYHFSETITDGKLSFDYQLKKGSLENTNAIRILEMNGFPAAIIQEATSLAKEIKELKQKMIKEG